MRPSRAIVVAAIVASGPVAAVLGLAGGSTSVAAAPAAALTAPVAQAPKVVAHAVVAPEHAAATKPKAVPAHHVTPTAPTHVATTHRTVTRPTTTKPVAARTAAAAAAPAVRTGNDYPYAGATSNATDKWGFTERQCVSFTAWRLARDGRPLDNATQNWGSALHWDEAARAHGVRISSTPRVGAIAQWNAGEGGKVWVGAGTGRFVAGSYGHVGYVAAVYSDGSALIEQYNAQGDRQYSVMRMTAPRYLF